MDVYRETFYRRSHFEKLAAKPLKHKPRTLYPALIILGLSALLWALILAPVIWLIRA